jgi:hypothetical protein
LYRHALARSTIVRTVDPVVLPAAVDAVVDFVGGVSTFPNLHRATNFKNLGAPSVNAATIKSLYNITETASGTSGASQAVAEFQVLCGGGFFSVPRTHTQPANCSRNHTCRLTLRSSRLTTSCLTSLSARARARLALTSRRRYTIDHDCECLSKQNWPAG